MKMFKFIFIITLTLGVALGLVLGGCKNPVKAEILEPPEIQEAVSEALEIEKAPIREEPVECTSRNDKEMFLEMNRGMYFHDGWIFYDNGADFRKCKPDLTEDTSVFPLTGRYFNILNQEGIATIKVYPGESRKPGDDEVHILDVHTGKSEKIDRLDTEYMGYRLLYKDYLIVVQQIVIEGHGAATQLDLYGRQGNFIKTIAPYVNYTCFAVVDNAVYYLQYYGDEKRTSPSNKVMRYDIISGETEVVLEFDLPEAPEVGYPSWSTVYFTGRTIIAHSKDAFVYTSIDEIEPKKILFSEIHKGEGDFVITVIPSVDEDIYFQSLHFGEGGDENGFLYSRFYKMARGTNEPIFLKETDGDIRGFAVFSEGYLYHLLYGGDIAREKLC